MGPTKAVEMEIRMKTATSRLRTTSVMVDAQIDGVLPAQGQDVEKTHVAGEVEPR